MKKYSASTQSFSKLILFLCTLCLSSWVAASNFQLVSPDAVLKSITESATTSDKDLLIVTPPNSAGISLNDFSQFDVVNRPLQLINLPTENPAATTIVILADAINLQNKVEIVGVAADVIFLSTHGNGVIDCVSCSFSNMYRVSLVTAQPDQVLSYSMSRVGLLTPPATSSVSINNLDAPGVISLEVVSEELNLSGEINTNLKATKDIAGSYVVDSVGDYIVGAGEVNIQLGPVTWDYDAHEIVSVPSESYSYVINGSIKSSGVKITTSGNLDLNTDIDTRSDLLSPIKYFGELYMPKENVIVQTFSNGNLVATGDMVSFGKVSLKSINSLYIENPQSLWVTEWLELIAKNQISLKSEINANNLSIAGNGVANEGSLLVDSALQVLADEYFANQYGGYINADVMLLKSQNGVIRNGSRTPYRTTDTELAGFISIPSPNLVSYNPEKMGAFYGLGSVVNTSNASLQMPEDSAARIVANEIRIDANAFENINPYYEFAVGDSDPILDSVRERQVSVTADQKLEISTRRYLLNSSAMIELNSAETILKLHGPQVQNERYRMVTTIASSEDYSGTRTYVNSPPGVLIGMGDTEINAPTSFVSNVSIFEIFGNTKVYTAALKIYGMRNEGYISGGNHTVSVISPYISTSSSGSNPGLNHKEVDETQTISIPSVKYGEQDSLFFVHGDLITNSDPQFTAHMPLDNFINTLINNAVAETIHEHTYVSKNGSTYKLKAVNGRDDYQNMEAYDFHGYVRDGRKYRFYYDKLTTSSNSVSSAKASGTIDVNWKDQWRKQQFKTDKSVHEDHTRTLDRFSYTGTDEYSLFDELKELYNSMKDTITNLYNELKWWD